MVEISQSIAEDTHDPVETARQTLQSLNPDDEEYFATLNVLANQLMARFKRSGSPNDLNEGVERTKELLVLTSPSHSFHLPALSNLGMALQTRFRFLGDAEDLTQAIHHFEACVESCAPGHSHYVPFVANLAGSLRSRYSLDGDISDLNRIVEICSIALSICASENLYRDVLLNNFANALKDRFEKRGDRADLEIALTYYQACLDLRPPGHPKRYLVLGNLGDVMHLKFQVDGDQDLESAADYYVAALNLRSPGQEGYVLFLTGLGAVLWTLFDAKGDTEKMEMAISCYQTALASSTVANLDHARLLHNYGGALRTRYTKFGDINDLNQAIQYLTASYNINIQSPSFPNRFITVHYLGGTLLTRFNATGHVADLDLSVEHLASSLQLCPPSHHERPGILSVYSSALLARFHAKGHVENLNLAISVCKDALDSLSPKHATYSSTMGNLTSVLLECFKQSGNVDDIQVIIDHCDTALVSTSPAQTAFITLQTNRAMAFLERFQYGGDKPDVDIAIDPFREVVEALSKGHVDYIPAHTGFATALQIRFQLTTHHRDLDEAIEHYRSARRCCRRGDTNHVPVCMGLGNALRLRSEYSGDIDALDESIVLLSEVEELMSTASGNSWYTVSLVNLGIALFMRFQAQRNIADLNVAIERVTRGLALPTPHEFIIHSTLATLLSVRYDEHKVLDDLEQSIKYFGSAAHRMPENHLLRSTLCRNYGHTLAKLAHYRDPIDNLNIAIALYRDAMTRSPNDHYDQPLTVLQLAEAVHRRGIILQSDDDIGVAIHLLKGLIQIVPEGHWALQEIYRSSASTAMDMYDLYKLFRPSESKGEDFMEEAFRYYEKGARYSHLSSYQSVAIALQWAGFADKLNHSSALQAYRTSLNSLDQHVLSTQSVKHRHGTLHRLARHTSSLAVDATACAIYEGRVELAIELSEQGRGLLWSQMARIRTPLDSLRSVDEEGQTLALEFERISSQLARRSVSASDGVLLVSRLSQEEDARRYRQLSNELDAVMERIRAKEGFQSFLQPMSFLNLQKAAAGGPVIIANVSERRCDAIIVLHDEPPCLVPLPHATIGGITAMSGMFYRALKATSYVGEEKERVKQIVPILRRLWDIVVSPVVEKLAELQLPRGSRIWWCPTSKLTSLPLHATGPYRSRTDNLSNIYISSYTPTLSALIRSRNQKASHPGVPPPFIAIGQSNPNPENSTGESELKAIAGELDLVESLVPTSMTFDRISDDNSTADAAIEGLRTHSWVHLACHGNQDLAQPFDSSFSLRDRPLTLLDIVRAELAHPEFAFLSACHTAVGDENTPDEVIHLAAGMQFSGFRSVIGTMWAVDDAMAETMVGAFYKNMFDGGVVDCTNAARALNKASKTVDKNVVSMDQRIVFIHIGA
ncbi:hypothetical protein BS17DRAFT_760983 [Gyrodon lividus]|nr:hypothetical protein BS17DRAFT_760983 [Gyrodon lividus]